MSQKGKRVRNGRREKVLMASRKEARLEGLQWRGMGAPLFLGEVEELRKLQELMQFLSRDKKAE